MTMVETGLQYWPLRAVTGGFESFAAASVSLGFDSATDRLAYICSTPYTDSIETIYVRTGTVTTGCDIDMRVESVSNGRPSGTLLDTNTNIVVTVADGDDGVWKTCTLTSPADVTPGLQFAIVIIVNSGTPNMNFVALATGMTGFSGQIPTLLQDAGGGTWAHITSTDCISLFVELASAGVVALPNITSLQPAGTIQAFDSADSPDEYALKFQSTVPRRAVGVSVFMFNVVVNGSMTLSLWPASSSDDGDALAQITLDSDTFATNASDGYVDLFFPDAVTIAKDTVYYVGVRADTATDISVGFYVTPSAITNSQRASYVQSTNIHLSKRTWTAGTAGAWSDEANQVLLASIIYDQLDDGAGGGSGGNANILRGSVVA